MTRNPLYKSPSTTYMFTQERTVSPLEPDTFEPSLAEIMHALPNINRYNGHTTRPYSVAEHSINCMRAGAMFYGLSDVHEKLYLLLHDAPETYLQDLIRPIKMYMNDDILLAEKVIFDKLVSLLPLTEEQREDLSNKHFLLIVEDIDTRMACTEMDELFPKHGNPLTDFNPFVMNINCLEHFNSVVPYVYKALIDACMKKLQRNLTCQLKDGEW